MLSTNNPVVLDFYNGHPSLDFETMNVLFVGILNNLFSELAPNLDNNFILTILNDSINKKIAEMNKSFVEDVKVVLNNNNKITKTIIDVSLNSQKEIDEKVSQVLKKFDSSTKKGSMSEMFTYHLLRSMYPEQEVKLVNTIKETGDILLARSGLPVIMFENKDYTNPVSQTEVNKFIEILVFKIVLVYLFLKIVQLQIKKNLKFVFMVITLEFIFQMQIIVKV